jgi:hypothetical protein
MPKTGITLVKYTERSFVVRGDTHPYKNDLKSLGGKWNSRLTDPETSEQFGAWVYPNTKTEDVQSWMSSPDRPVYETTHSTVSSDQVTTELKKLSVKLDNMSKQINKIYTFMDKLTVYFKLNEDDDEEDEDEEYFTPRTRLL